jgi:hypothetical protein
VAAKAARKWIAKAVARVDLDKVDLVRVARAVRVAWAEPAAKVDLVRVVPAKVDLVRVVPAKVHPAAKVAAWVDPAAMAAAWVDPVAKVAVWVDPAAMAAAWAHPAVKVGLAARVADSLNRAVKSKIAPCFALCT